MYSSSTKVNSHINLRDKFIINHVKDLLHYFLFI